MRLRVTNGCGMKSTTRLLNTQVVAESPEIQAESVDLGMVRPWRIALIIKHMQVQLIVDLIDSLVVGRFGADSENPPDIDLRPFNAEQMGVSRRHLLMKLEGDTVMAIDNHSSNGTTLNGRRLNPGEPCALRHGDELVLGALKMQIALLINPLD